MLLHSPEASSDARAQGEPQRTPAIQDKLVLPRPVCLEDVCTGVKQPTGDLDDEFDLAKDHIDIAGEVIEDDWAVGLPSGDAGIVEQAMEFALRCRPRLIARIEQQVTLGWVTDSCGC